MAAKQVSIGTELPRFFPTEKTLADYLYDRDLNCDPTFLDILTDINSILGGEMSKAGKSAIFNYLNGLTEMYENIRVENAALQAENKLLRELHSTSTSTSTTSSKTYAAAVSTAPKSPSVIARVNKSVEQKRHHVFVTSTEGKPSKEAQRIFTKALHPAQDKLIIRGLRSTDTTLIVETATESDADMIINHPLLSNKRVTLEKTRKRNPLVILYDMPAEAPEEDLITRMYHQNFKESMLLEDFKQECKLRFTAGPRNRPTVHLVFEMTSRLRKNTISKGRLSPPWCLRLIVAVGFECSDELKSYANGSVATDRASHVGQVLGEEPDKVRHPGPPGWGLRRVVGVPPL